MSETQTEFCSSLPVSPDHFVGRTGDLRAALAQLQSGNERLLTITGPGGVGKTRFALELARRLEPRFVDGATWVDCADLKTPLEGMRRTLEGLSEQAGANPLRQLERVLRDQERLIVLDNLEQIRGMGKVLESLLGVCPSVTVLATSRSPLRTPFERRYPLLPLECPPFEAQTPPNVIFQTEAAQLFLERAVRVEPHFSPSEQEAQLLAQLCGLLDGLPLALELAASQMGNYSLRELLERVQAGRALPTSRERGARQSSLENNLSWGFELLEPSEQTLLMRLGLLEGTFQRDLLEAFAPREFEDLLEVSLDILVESGWVKRSEQGFKLLETVRVFALSRAKEHALEESSMRALFDFLIPLALEAGKQLFTSEIAPAMEWLERIWPHLRRVLVWGNQNGEHAQVIQIVQTTLNWSLNGSYLGELIALLQSSLKQPGLELELEIKGFRALSRLLEARGLNSAAQKALEQATTRAKSSPEFNTYLPILERNLGNILFAQGSWIQAELCFERALAYQQKQDDVRGELLIRHDLGRLLQEQGRFELARAQLEAGLRLIEDVDNPFLRAALVLQLAVAVRYLGELPLTLSLFRQLIINVGELGMPALLTHVHHGLGLALISSDPVQARIHLLEAIRLKRLYDRGLGLVESLGVLALLEQSEKKYADAQIVLLEAIALVDPLDVPIRLMFLLEELAALEVQTRDYPLAAQLLGAAKCLTQQQSFRRLPEFQEQLEHTKQQLEAQLGEDFATHLEQGRAQGHLPLLERYGLQLRYRLMPLPQTLKKEQSSSGQLSPRESEVLKLLAQGFTNKQIAAQLQLSSHTIRGFVVGLFNKLGCKTRAQAVSKASQLGLL